VVWKKEGEKEKTSIRFEGRNRDRKENVSGKEKVGFTGPNSQDRRSYTWPFDVVTGRGVGGKKKKRLFIPRYEEGRSKHVVTCKERSSFFP